MGKATSTPTLLNSHLVTLCLSLERMCSQNISQPKENEQKAAAPLSPPSHPCLLYAYQRALFPLNAHVL